jgi:hypothetical protein
MADPQIQALVSTHWNEFMAKEIVLAQGIAGLEREADEGGQLQLAIHKLKRARLEVACYSDAISKIARTMRLARCHATGHGESGFPRTNIILISHQAGVVIMPITNKACPPPPKARLLVPDNNMPCWQDFMNAMYWYIKQTFFLWSLPPCIPSAARPQL